MASRRSTVRKYYQGWVYVKRSQGYQRLFAQLRAKKDLRFYLDETKAMGSGNKCEYKIDLKGLKDISMKCDRRMTNQNPEYMVILHFEQPCDSSEEKLRIATSEERDVWVRYLRAAGLNKLPESTSHLLPGQIHEIQDIIREESKVEGDYEDMVPNHESSQPWYYPLVTERHDAEEILKSRSVQGNMLVRKRHTDQSSNDDCEYALSAITSDIPPQFKHYKIKFCEKTNFFEVFLKVNPHPKFKTLDEIMIYFEHRSNGEYKRCRVMVSRPNHVYEPHLFTSVDDHLYVNGTCGRF